MSVHNIIEADYVRDQKRVGQMCAHGCCTAPATNDAPDGYTGPYGGDGLCTEHYQDVVDEIVETDGDPSWD